MDFFDPLTGLPGGIVSDNGNVWAPMFLMPNDPPDVYDTRILGSLPFLDQNRVISDYDNFDHPVLRLFNGVSIFPQPSVPDMASGLIVLSSVHDDSTAAPPPPDRTASYYHRAPTVVSTTEIPWAHVEVTTWSDRSVTTAVKTDPW